MAARNTNAPRQELKRTFVLPASLEPPPTPGYDLWYPVTRWLSILVPTVPPAPS
jgi:hypothetical protein